MIPSTKTRLVVDGAREYSAPAFLEACAKQGVEVVCEIPSNPMHKGRVERAFVAARAAQAKTREAKA